MAPNSPLKTKEGTYPRHTDVCHSGDTFLCSRTQNRTGDHASLTKLMAPPGEKGGLALNTILAQALGPASCSDDLMMLEAKR